MGHHTEAFVGIDTSKSSNAIAIADGGRGGEGRILARGAQGVAYVQPDVADESCVVHNRDLVISVARVVDLRLIAWLPDSLLLF